MYKPKPIAPEYSKGIDLADEYVLVSRRGESNVYSKCGKPLQAAFRKGDLCFARRGTELLRWDEVNGYWNTIISDSELQERVLAAQQRVMKIGR